MLARDDLSMAMRQALLCKLSQTLAGFVAARQWMGPEHAEYAAREACEKATVALAADTAYEEVGALVPHLRQSGQLTAGMILRALLSGNVVLFEEALAELSDMPIDRVTGYIHDKNISGFRALYRKAGLPDVAYPAFREAMAAMREGLLVGGQRGAARFKRRVVERVLNACAENAARTAFHCWHCCGDSRSKPRARKPGCSATIWSPTMHHARRQFRAGAARRRLTFIEERSTDP